MTSARTTLDQGVPVTSTRITLDVQFDPDATIVDLAYRHNDLTPLEVLGALDMARQQILNEATS